VEKSARMIDEESASVIFISSRHTTIHRNKAGGSALNLIAPNIVAGFEMTGIYDTGGIGRSKTRLVLFAM
jgi:hypothetical protein